MLRIQPDGGHTMLVFQAITVFSHLFSTRAQDGHPYFRGTPLFPLQVHLHPITLAIQNRCRDLPTFQRLTRLKDPPALRFFPIRNAIANRPHHAL
jgi:hypothetical protein